MKKLIAVLVFTLPLILLEAQSFTGKLNPYPQTEKVVNSLKILAVMVEFQEDRDNSTFGNGKFGSVYTGENRDKKDILDPLPFDRDYFGQHLLFAKNYFGKVSGAALSVDYTLLDSIITVSKTMRNYSPEPGSNDLINLAEFSKEVWQLVDAEYSGTVNFSSYDLFAIFHAGVGRDVSLPGSIGSERDLPSVYLSPAAFKNVYGSAFTGISVTGGTIENTMILPSTESREIDVIGGKVLFELSTNGLICASIGSYLGLPDLFNTETGLSAIGRFGLMDGQSIFAYGGLFPPEPSPWEKIRLGWITPQTASLSGSSYQVSDKISGSGPLTVLKVNINSSEYYLVENRQRDALSDSSKVTYYSEGVYRTKVFPKDTTGYQSYDIDSLYGVVVDVDEFDWAVPGNGVVIWHIDEKIINENIASNTINNDKYRRGVDVEEADGVQDIGETFYTIFGDEVIGEGSVSDFWYDGNKAVLYENRFGPETTPSTSTNDGANSLVTFSNFSTISSLMSFDLSYSNSGIQLKNTLSFSSLNLPDAPYRYASGSDEIVFIIEGGNLKVFNGYGNLIETVPSFGEKTAFLEKDGVLTAVGFQQLPASTNINVYSRAGSNVRKAALSSWIKMSSQPVLGLSATGSVKLYSGAVNGKIYLSEIDPAAVSLITPVDSVSLFSNDPIKFVFTDFAGYFGGISGSKYSDHSGASAELSDSASAAAVIRNSDNQTLVVIQTKNNTFYTLENSDIRNQFTVNSAAAIGRFSLGFSSLTNEPVIQYTNGKYLEVRELSGAYMDGFPVEHPADLDFSLTPLSADINGDNVSDILTLDQNGDVFAFSGKNAKILNGFPLSSGMRSAKNIELSVIGNTVSLTAFSIENNYFIWELNTDQNAVYWKGETVSRANNVYLEQTLARKSVSDYFPPERAYNWPNPVYDGETFIRYYVSENSSVSIAIYDLAGDLVEELSASASGGMDNEIKWDTHDISSGVYFARIKAESSSGKSSEKVVRIAVIK